MYPTCELISLLPANESQLLFSFKLGLPVFSCATCPACGKSKDPYGDDALCCPLTGFAIRYLFLKEEKLVSFRIPSLRLALRFLYRGHKTAALISCLLADSQSHVPTLSTSPLSTLPIADVVPGKVADRRATIKEAQYEARCSVAGMGFCALVALRDHGGTGSSHEVRLPRFPDLSISS